MTRYERGVAGVAHPRPKVRERGQGAHRNARGTPKLGYLTEERAQLRAAEMAETNGHAMSHYRCVECGLWHLGKGQ